MFLLHASEIWTKSYGPNYTKYWAFWQKTCFFITIIDTIIGAILKEVSESKNN